MGNGPPRPAQASPALVSSPLTKSGSRTVGGWSRNSWLPPSCVSPAHLAGPKHAGKLEDSGRSGIPVACACAPACARTHAHARTSGGASRGGGNGDGILRCLSVSPKTRVSPGWEVSEEKKRCLSGRGWGWGVSVSRPSSCTHSAGLSNLVTPSLLQACTPS